MDKCFGTNNINPLPLHPSDSSNEFTTDIVKTVPSLARKKAINFKSQDDVILET